MAADSFAIFAHLFDRKVGSLCLFYCFEKIGPNLGDFESLFTYKLKVRKERRRKEKKRD